MQKLCKFLKTEWEKKRKCNILTYIRKNVGSLQKMILFNIHLNKKEKSESEFCIFQKKFTTNNKMLFLAISKYKSRNLNKMQTFCIFRNELS